MLKSADIRDICAAATACLAGGDAAGAARIVAEAMRHAPRDPNLLYVAGNCALATHDLATARKRYAESVAAAPTFVAALSNLGFVLRISHEVSEARVVLRRAVTLEPANVQAWMNYVACYVNEGAAEEGEAVAREALLLHPDNPVLTWNQALVLLEQGKWREGWRAYRRRFDSPVVMPPLPQNGRRLIDPDDLSPGAAVVVCGEQGLGDEILFAGVLAEFIADATRRGAHVTLAPNPRLASLFARTFPVPQLNRTEPSGSADGTHVSDWVVAMGDLPGFYRNDNREFPHRRRYLLVDQAAVEGVRQRLGGDCSGLPLVGIAWRGGTSYTHGIHRTIPLPSWLPILRQRARFVSLAYHDDATEVEHACAANGCEVIRLPDVMQAHDYERTCEVVAALDLVITVPTSVHHVAGAVGTSCWLLTDERAAWRECSRDESLPWYPRTHRRMVRPRDQTDWDGMLARVAERLGEWTAGPPASAEPS